MTYTVDISYTNVTRKSCTNEVFSGVYIYCTSLDHADEIAQLLTSELKRNGLSGKFTLLCTDAMVIGFKYYYANEEELEANEWLTFELANLANEFSEMEAKRASYYEREYNIAE